MVGQTRVHLDEVEGLGSFMELEVSGIGLANIKPRLCQLSIIFVLFHLYRPIAVFTSHTEPVMFLHRHVMLGQRRRL